MSAAKPAPLQIGKTVHIELAGDRERLSPVEILAVGDVPSPYVLVQRPWGEETVVFVGPGVTITATP